MKIAWYSDGLIEEDALAWGTALLIPVAGDPREVVWADGPWDRRKRWVQTVLNRIGTTVDQSLTWCWPQ